jgi:PA domain
MKKTMIILLLAAIASAAIAQTQKRDTVVLSVYNTSQRFMLYPMPFGKDRPDVDFTAPMLVALDTIHTVEVSTRKDTTGKYPKRLITKRQCGKLPKDSLTGKVALLYMNAGCDVSTQVYNAQKSGAIVVIVIHTTDNRDSVELPKQGANQVRYADASKVRIPCFTVRKGIGEKLTTMLPSVSGIQRPKTNVTNPATSVVANNPATLVAQQPS